MSVGFLYERVATIARRVLEALVILSFAMMVLLVFAQVVTRYLTDNSLTWSEELSRFIMVWMVYLASVLTYNARQHIVVDALTAQLKGLAKTIILLMNKLAVMVFVVFVIIGATQFLPTTAIQKSPANSIVMAHVYIVLPLSLFCIGILDIRDIVILVRSLIKKEVPAGEEVTV